MPFDIVVAVPYALTAILMVGVIFILHRTRVATRAATYSTLQRAGYGALGTPRWLQ